MPENWQLTNTDCLFLLTASVGQRNCEILLNEDAHHMSTLPTTNCQYILFFFRMENLQKVFINCACVVTGQLPYMKSIFALYQQCSSWKHNYNEKYWLINGMLSETKENLLIGKYKRGAHFAINNLR